MLNVKLNENKQIVQEILFLAKSEIFEKYYCDCFIKGMSSLKRWYSFFSFNQNQLNKKYDFYHKYGKISFEYFMLNGIMNLETFLNRRINIMSVECPNTIIECMQYINALLCDYKFFQTEAMLTQNYMIPLDGVGACQLLMSKLKDKKLKEQLTIKPFAYKHLGFYTEHTFDYKNKAYNERDGV